MNMKDLLRAAEVAKATYQRPGVSVWAADVRTPLDLIQQAILPHEVVRFSTMGAIRDAGFTVEQTRQPPHHTVWLPEEDDCEYWLGCLASVFEPPVRKRDA
ncbi:hypothetical protein ACFVJS_22185 [Nocardioides sp. NPDC057772]|uniref:hypothetical protein n=1 Tax=Nocardioides sp. NPDC057772 TaxID=3346245 RepID=UPI0036704165